MCAALGLSALGAALLFSGKRVGLLQLSLGLLAGMMVRPHVAFLVFAAISIGFVVRRSSRPSPLSWLTKLASVAILVGAGTFLAGRVASFFSINNLSVTSVNHVLQQNIKNTAEPAGTPTQSGSPALETTESGGQSAQNGYGSSFNVSNVSSPEHYPVSLFTILYRPLPTEARSITVIIASLEGMALLLLTLTSWARIKQAIRAAGRQPYVMMALIYTLIFAYLFGSVANMGILARQRVQLLPFLLVLFAFPSRPGGGHKARSVRAASRRRTHTIPAAKLNARIPNASAATMSTASTTPPRAFGWPGR
jgi:hypothetical protein